MASRRGQRFGLLVGLLALGALAAWVVGRLPKPMPSASTAPALRGEARSPRRVTKHRVTTLRGEAPVAPTARLRGGAFPVSTDRPLPQPPAEAPTPRADAPPVGAAAVVNVRLLLPEAWREPGGEVYALPAGRRWSAEGSGLPHLEVTTEEVVRLPLPRAGDWDIGYVCPLGHVLAESVVAPRSEDVILDAWSAAPVSVRVVGALPEDPATSLRVSLRPPPDSATARYPGRGERSEITSVRVALGEGGFGTTPPLPAGVPFDVWVRSDASLRRTDEPPGVGYRALPRRVQAGEEVVLRPVRLGRLRIRLAFEGPVPDAWRRDWKTDLWTAVSATPLGGGTPSFTSTYLEKEGVLRSDTLFLPLPPGDYELAIGVGRAYHTKTRRVQVEAARTVEVEETLVPDADYRFGGSISEASAWATRVQVHVEGDASGPLRLLSLMRDEEGDLHVGRMTVASPEAGPLDLWDAVNRMERAQLLRFPDRASRIFAVPRRGEVRVRCVPAGCLVLIPEVVPDAALGVLGIRRRDGWPIPYQASPDPDAVELDGGFLVPVVPGRVIGPFPSGRLAFEIVLGGVVVGEAEATVPAGRMAPLTLEWLR